MLWGGFVTSVQAECIFRNKSVWLGRQFCFKSFWVGDAHCFQMYTQSCTQGKRERDMEKEQITRWNNRYSAEDKNHRKPIPASAQHAHYYITTITVPTLERMCVG